MFSTLIQFRGDMPVAFHSLTMRQAPRRHRGCSPNLATTSSSVSTTDCLRHATRCCPASRMAEIARVAAGSSLPSQRPASRLAASRFSMRIIDRRGCAGRRYSSGSGADAIAATARSIAVSRGSGLSSNAARITATMPSLVVIG